MKAEAIPLLNVFERKMRLEVPLFQRQYVWTREEQWEPLWEDIARKFDDYLRGRREAPAHFLGAMVLDQKLVPVSHVEKRQVIDGQQRLTTLQLFMAAFRDFARENGCDDIARESDRYTLNPGMMQDPEVEKFKVWPTQLDRAQFKDVMTAASRAELEKRYPLVKKKYARSYDPRPPMVEAYLFFREQLQEFFIGNGQPPIAAEAPLAQRLDECFQALKNTLKVAVIDLDQGDDAQVIFETLNARGQPLLPADLIRNYIFLRAARENEKAEELYEKYWRGFDDEFWRKEVKQGRLKRPRSDLFVQHFLASRQANDIPIKHLFAEYKYWIEKDRPFATLREELATLSRQADDFRKMLDPPADAPYARLMEFFEAFDIRTSYPLMLTLMDARISDADWRTISVALESYLLRRAVCGYTTKNYNRIFLNLSRDLRTGALKPAGIATYLAGLTGESVAWPTDADFQKAWLTSNAYERQGNPKLVHILTRLNESYMTNRTERVVIADEMTIEHLLPQQWIDNWPLPNGEKGMTWTELAEADDNDPRAIATRERNAALNTLGNLTLLTQPLNAAQSNAAWDSKKPQLMAHSVLALNLQLRDRSEWNEKEIERRGIALYEKARAVWPR